MPVQRNSVRKRTRRPNFMRNLSINNKNTSNLEEVENDEEKCTEKSVCHFSSSQFCKKLFITLFGILLVYVIVLVAVIIRNQIKKFDSIGHVEQSERVIMLEGKGKITAKPDIAVTNMGLTVKANTVAEAQAENTKVMNSLIEKLKSLKVSENDIQTTDYNIYPNYNYTEEDGRISDGYEVSQNIKVKIRDLESANKVLALAGEVGVNSVSGLDFTIDDKEVYKDEAREEALKNVWEKAGNLSKMLGVEIVGVVSYNEYEAGGVYDGYREEYSKSMVGFGGEIPSIESGSMDVEMTVNVAFEIR